MLYTKNLTKIVLETAVPNADEFVVISGWLSPSQIEKALELNKKIIALYGMTSGGISGPTHRVLKQMDSTNPDVKIYYALSANEVHSKCYIWRFNGKILKALIGSANFTFNGLNTSCKETLITVDSSDFSIMDKYINHVFDTSRVERCSTHNPRTKISSIPKTLLLDPNQLIISKSGTQVTTIRLTLLDKQGKVPNASGINWGQGTLAHNKPNDAYIKISKAAIKTGFFDPKEEIQVPIDVIWDDGTVMNCLEEGNQKSNHLLYPKQIASADRKEILGSYLRKRLEVPLGTKVTIQDLTRYGRTYIDVTITGPNSYYMDFSKN